MSEAPQKKPLPGKVWIFIQAYVACRDVEEAAVKARMKPRWGRRLYNMAEVYCEIRNLIDAEDNKAADIVSRSRALTVERLDAEMIETITELEPGVAKVKAIELGYTRTGVLDKGSLIVAPPSQSSPAELPQIYTAMQFRTVRRTTEEVTEQKQVTLSGSPPAKMLPPAEEDFEVFDLPDPANSKIGAGSV